MAKTRIPYVRFGGEGSVLHFAHANGFPPKAYKKLLRPLVANHRVIGIKHRPLWENQDHRQLHSWEQIADDLIRFLDEKKLSNIIGMGHSLGGTASVIAAIKRPDLFSKLVLIDPVIFPDHILKLSGLLPQFLRKKLVSPAKIALRRTDRWSSEKEVYDSWRKKKVFKNIDNDVLYNLIKTAIVPHSGGGVTLAYSKEWEAQVYITIMPVFSKLKKIKTPMMVIKGEHTDVLRDDLWADWQKAQPHNRFLSIENAGHLVPLEYPELLSKTIAEWLVET